MELGKISVYRMTHIENIPHILQFGITHKSSPNANKNFITIGDLRLIDTRSKKQVRVDNGDFFNFNSPVITLGDFIPFYFGVKMPMLYVMQNGGNFVERATPARDIIYLACSLIQIVDLGLLYYFSDGHATDNFTSFYDKDKIKKLPSLIDWDSIKASYWGGSENLNIKRKKQAELLVLNDLSPELIIGFGCYDNDSKSRLLTMGVEEKRIKVIPHSYF